MDGLSVEVKLCRGDCSLVVSSDKFASPFTLAVEQTCASVEHHIKHNANADAYSAVRKATCGKFATTSLVDGRPAPATPLP
jgi:hypothetical protein